MVMKDSNPLTKPPQRTRIISSSIFFELLRLDGDESFGTGVRFVICEGW